MSNIVVIESSIEDNIVTIDENNVFIEIINTEKILISDLPDDIPFAKIQLGTFGNGFDGLDNYLDQYSFDCGTP